MKKNLSAKKSLGQNFLKSKKAINQMVSTANITKDDFIIEIGPGKGILTEAILETGAKLIAFELDERMVSFLREKFEFFIKTGQFQLVQGDILKINLETFIGNKNYKLIANIPYYITNAIIRKFLETKYQPSDMILLVQKEVAERIVVRNGKESLLSLSVAIFGDVKYISKVDRKYFSPSPKVHSAIIHIFNISRDKIVTDEREELFFKIIHAAFAHKRKKCIKNLQKIIDKDILTNIFLSLGLDLNIRAEEIDINTWIKILDLL